MSAFIDELKKIEIIDLTIISVYSNLKKDVSLEEDGVVYHLLSQKMPFFDRGFPFIVKKLTKYRFLRKKVRKIIDQIQPDIVHLHGSETDLSECYCDITWAKMYSPLGIMADQYSSNRGKYFEYLALREKRIVIESRYIGIRANFMTEFFTNTNPSVKLFWHSYMLTWPKISYYDYPDKDADIVYFARIHKNKGIEDILRAVYFIKVEYGIRLKLKIIGAGSDPKYSSYLKSLINDLKLTDDVRFFGKVNDYDDLSVEIAKSRLFVLPTYFDIIPGSLLEAMLIGVPVIAYAVGGIPDLNIKEKLITLSEPNNIIELSRKIVLVLGNHDEYLQMAKNGINFIIENYNNAKTVHDLLSIYENIYSRSI